MSRPDRFSLISFFPHLSTVLFVTIFFSFVALGPKAMNMDGDLGRHLTVGGYILDHRQIPTADVFSHTRAGEPLTPHEWLADVLFTLAYRWLGLNGVVLLSALVVALAFSLVLKETLLVNPVLLIGLGFTILAGFASSLHWLTRPHLFTFLLVVVWMSGLERLRRGEFRFWWLLPLCMLVWANLHGAFIAGFVIWAMYLGGYLWDRFWARNDPPPFPGYGRFLLFAGGSAGLATLINPAGLKLWATSLGYLGNSYLTGHTNEYLSPDFHQTSTWPFLALIMLSLVLIGLVKSRPPMVHLLMIAGWTVMGLYSARNIPIYALVAAPILAGLAGAWLNSFDRLKPFLSLNQRLLVIERTPLYFPWSVLAVILVSIGLVRGIPLDYQQTGNHFSPTEFPVAAVDWLETHPPVGNTFNYFPWGGYLLYRMWPEQKVFIDGQTDFYGEALTRQYDQVYSLAPGWQEVLSQYQVGWVIVPTGARLAGALEGLPGWRSVYQDKTAVVIAHDQ